KIACNGIRGYQPQLSFLPELRAFVVSDFRIGNESYSKAVVSCLEHCKANMPDGTRIRMVRGDAAYCQRAVMN
ncbi:IS1380 family transposase, partial [bacterium]|nr:IS1380 family transposase [bacterium]